MKLCSSLVFVMLVASTYAGDLVWDGSDGIWTHSKWLSEGAQSGQAIPAAIHDRLEITSGNVTVEGDLTGAPGSLQENHLTLGGDSRLAVQGALDFGTGKAENAHSWSMSFLMKESASLSATHIQLKTKKLERSALTFAGGTLTLTSGNPILGCNFPDQNVNIKASAGGFRLIATANPFPGKSLATKVGSDLFSIDGRKINVAESGLDVEALNMELAGKVVNGKILRIKGENNGPQILEIITAGDEPAVIELPEEPVEEPVSPVRKRKRNRPEANLHEPELSAEPLGLILS
ncbi:hypothetical protein [Pontiella desulfatans]|nr:hypothetical protein [Pontiella desulfatans]